MSDPKGLSKGLRASLRIATSELGELHDAGSLVAMLGLLLSIPWVLFLGEGSPGLAQEARSVAFVSFQLVFAATMAVVGRAAPGRFEIKGKLGVAGAVTLSAGVAILCVVDAAPALPRVAATWGAAVGGGLTACGYGALVAVWWMPYSRIRVEQSTWCAIAAMALSAALVALAEVIVDPYGGALYALVCIVTPLVSRKVARGHFPAPCDPADTASRSDAFVLSSKRKLYALFALSFFIFGGCAFDFLDGGLLASHPAALRLAALVAAVFVIAAAICFARLKRRSVLMTLLVTAFCLVFLGSVACSYEGFAAPGAVVLVAGFVSLNVFYVAYYSGICKRKGFSDERSKVILVRTMLVVPMALLSAAGISWLLSFAPHFGHASVLAGQCAMLLVFVSMFYEEVTRTREELSRKLDSVITLRDIRQFALETSEDYRLTDRECEIVQLLMSGRSVATAAKELYLSESTVKTHVRSIYKKMGVHNRQEMIVLVNEWVGK